MNPPAPPDGKAASGTLSLFLPGLHGGGAERVMVQLANAFAARGLDVDLVVATPEGPYRSEVSPAVNLVDLGARRVVRSLPALVRYLRRRQPAALLSTLEHSNVTAVLASRLAGFRGRVVLREANVFVPVNQGLKARLLPTLTRLLYPAADQLVAVSQAVAQSLQDDLGVPAARIRTIYNPVLSRRVAERLREPVEEPWLVTPDVPVILGAGRLNHQKDFETLIRAFARVRRERPARLLILGEGEKRPVLEALIRELKLENDVKLAGFQANIFAYLARAHTFALSSRFEGLPGVLIQALAAGCAVVATDAPGGSREILEAGRWGRLVPVGDAPALGEALLQALENPRPGPPHAALARFQEDAAVDQYLQVLLPGAGGAQTAAPHLALLLTSLSYGGAQTQVVALAAQFRQRGWRVSVISLLPPEGLKTELEQVGAQVYSLGMRRGWPDPRAWLALGRWLRTQRPTLLHSHMVHANLLARLAAKNQPLICTAHNISEGARWREYAYRLTDPGCDLTTNVSRAATARYVQVGAAPRERIRYVPNGVDTVRFRPDPALGRAARAELKLGAGFTWLAVGRFEEAKDYPNLLRAFARVQAAQPQARLLLAGDGPERPYAQQYAAALGLRASVEFLGLRRDVPALMNAADAYVMSSAWEGLPMVLLEAMACGLPLVATAVGGNGELISERQNGQLVPAHDSPALARAMLEIMRLTPPERAAYGQASRRKVEQEYALERVADLWQAIYGEVVEKRNA